MRINDLKGPAPAKTNTFVSMARGLNSTPHAMRVTDPRPLKFEPLEKGHFVHLFFPHRNIKVSFCYGTSPEAGKISAPSLERAFNVLFENAREGRIWSKHFRITEGKKTITTLFLELSERSKDDISTVFDFDLWPETSAMAPLIKGVIEIFKQDPPKTRGTAKVKF